MIDKDIIELLVSFELEEANEKRPLFRIPHEAYAVLLEEVEEMEDEVRAISDHMEIMWDYVKSDKDIEDRAVVIYKRAIRTIQEAVQVAAMCQKIKVSDIYGRKQNEQEES